MINPVNNIDKIYFLFDSVFLLKSVRNNGINLTNTHESFTFPDIDDNTVILYASFDHLKVLYNRELNSTVKQTFKLTLKSLFPHSIERQNVRLVSKIADDSTAKALVNVCPKHAELLN